MPPHAALAPLLTLLFLPRITEVFWDARADALELHLCYGFVLSNVRYVQLVDVSSRVHNSTLGQPASDILRGFLKSLQAEVERNSALNADIYALRDLEHAVGWFERIPRNREQTFKDRKPRLLLLSPFPRLSRASGGRGDAGLVRVRAPPCTPPTYTYSHTPRLTSHSSRSSTLTSRAARVCSAPSSRYRRSPPCTSARSARARG